ncbi:uncharacterized protein V6R79_018580 [Siganus canaliculatus]
MKKDVTTIQKASSEHEKKISELEEKLNEAERYQRRWNLRLYGLPEQGGEDIKRRVTEICSAIAPEVRDPLLHVDISHRIGRQMEGKTRLVIISDTPAESPALVIGSSILRNVKLETPATTVRCIPGARAGDVKSYLKLLAKSKRRYRRIVIHVSGNDTRLRQSEVTKVNIESVCTFAKTMSDSVVFSGPLPNMTSDDMFSQFLSSLVLKSASVIVVGDFNIHVDNESDSLSRAFLSLLESVGFSECVHEPTHCFLHTLDLVLSYGVEINNLTVFPQNPLLSNHALITFDFLLLDDLPSAKSVYTRHLSDQTVLQFKEEIFSQSVFSSVPCLNVAVDPFSDVNSSPAQIDQIVECAAGSLRSTLDLIAPLKKKDLKPKKRAPWFNSQTRELKKTTQKLEPTSQLAAASYKKKRIPKENAFSQCVSPSFTSVLLTVVFASLVTDPCEDAEFSPQRTKFARQRDALRAASSERPPAEAHRMSRAPPKRPSATSASQQQSNEP